VGYYNSFVVRIWSDEQGLSRGSIEHVRTHDSLVFGDPAAVVEFIRVHMAAPPSYIPHSEEMGKEEDEMGGLESFK
jgi:hypothetical protein